MKLRRNIRVLHTLQLEINDFNERAHEQGWQNNRSGIDTRTQMASTTRSSNE